MHEATKEDLCNIPITIPLNSSVVGLRVAGSGMADIGIEDGDHILLEKCNFLKNEEIDAIRYNNKPTLKEFCQQENCILLISENKNYNTIEIQPDEFEEVSAIGKYTGKTRKKILTGGICF